MRKRKKDIFSEVADNELWNLYEIFHENTKLNRLNTREYGTFIEMVTKQPYFLKRMSQSYKIYPGNKFIKLPRVYHSSKKSIEDILEHRRSVRDFSGKPLKLAEVAQLLHFSYGISDKIPVPKDKSIIQYLRVAPSAGALYPLEIYIAVFYCKKLKAGIYHYNVLNHTLEELEIGDFRQDIADACMIDNILANASLAVIITGVFKRTTFKYHERGYRFVLMESGHVAQNLSLICEAMELGTVLIGGFKDDELNKIIKIDGVNETALYPIIVGRKCH